MINKDFNSAKELLETFQTEQDCINHLEALRWSGNVISPFDRNSKVYRCKNNRYRCRNTGKYFNVKTKTLFDNSKIKLQTWILAIWIVTSYKKISFIQLSKEIKVTPKTAKTMLEKIKKCIDINNK